MLSKKKILLIQSCLQPPGGGNAVTTWTLEALKNNYDITILTWMPIDFAQTNRYYGTSLRQADFEIRVVPAIIRRLINLIPDPHYFQRHCVLMRWCKLIKRHYDIVMTAHNETDFGKKGIQYVHFPYLQNHWQRESDRCNRPWFHRLPAVLVDKCRPWRIISGYSFKRMKQNLSLVNSNWTGKHFQETYGTEAITVYPPVPGNYPEIPWQERENGFVCIGRIIVDKRLEEIIDILSVVRLHFPEIHLHIIGTMGEYKKDVNYYRRVLYKVEKNAEWVFINENISREELVGTVCRHRYGIHAMRNEHFGIAVAEMIRGHCIVFAPNRGGQVEVIGNEQRLLFNNKEEAVTKILHVMSHAHERTLLRQYIDLRNGLFSTEKFMCHIQEIVSGFVRDSNAQ